MGGVDNKGQPPVGGARQVKGQEEVHKREPSYKGTKIGKLIEGLPRLKKGEYENKFDKTALRIRGTRTAVQAYEAVISEQEKVIEELKGTLESLKKNFERDVERGMDEKTFDAKFEDYQKAVAEAKTQAKSDLTELSGEANNLQNHFRTDNIKRSFRDILFGSKGKKIEGLFKKIIDTPEKAENVIKSKIPRDEHELIGVETIALLKEKAKNPLNPKSKNYFKFVHDSALKKAGITSEEDKSTINRYLDGLSSNERKTFNNQYNNDTSRAERYQTIIAESDPQEEALPVKAVEVEVIEPVAPVVFQEEVVADVAPQEKTRASFNTRSIRKDHKEILRQQEVVLEELKRDLNSLDINFKKVEDKEAQEAYQATQESNIKEAKKALLALAVQAIENEKRFDAAYTTKFRKLVTRLTGKVISKSFNKLHASILKDEDKINESIEEILNSRVTESRVTESRVTESRVTESKVAEAIENYVNHPVYKVGLINFFTKYFTDAEFDRLMNNKDSFMNNMDQITKEIEYFMNLAIKVHNARGDEEKLRELAVSLKDKESQQVIVPPMPKSTSSEMVTPAIVKGSSKSASEVALTYPSFLTDDSDRLIFDKIYSDPKDRAAMNKAMREAMDEGHDSLELHSGLLAQMNDEILNDIDEGLSDLKNAIADIRTNIEVSQQWNKKDFIKYILDLIFKAKEDMLLYSIFADGLATDMDQFLALEGNDDLKQAVEELDVLIGEYESIFTALKEDASPLLSPSKERLIEAKKQSTKKLDEILAKLEELENLTTPEIEEGEDSLDLSQE